MADVKKATAAIGSIRGPPSCSSIIDRVTYVSDLLQSARSSVDARRELSKDLVFSGTLVSLLHLCNKMSAVQVGAPGQAPGLPLELPA